MKKFILLLLLLPAIYAPGQKALPEDIVKSIQQRIEFGHSPSYVVGIIDRDGPRYFSFGTKTIGGEPVDEHSIYEIGSISKTFTGILLADMVLRGKLKLEDPAQKYLPSTVTMPTRNGQQITLGHLSDHSSGLPGMPGNFNPADMANPYADYTVEQMYQFLSSFTLIRDIGSAYEYSNLAVGLLGQIVAARAGSSYEELMIKRIAAPLGMKETKITFDGHMKQNLAMGHDQGVQVANWDLPTFAGAGAIRSSARDMLIYLAANLGLKKSKLYPAMKLSHTVRHDKVGRGIRVGLNWHISKGAEGDVIWHNGGTGGYRTFAGFVRETGKGVVVLTNSSKGADDIGFRLLNPEAKLIEVKKPEKLESITVDENILETYTGNYELAPGFKITITREGAQLFGQATGQGKFELLALSPTEFFLKVAEIRITFNIKDGKPESLTLYQNGQAIPGKKVD